MRQRLARRFQHVLLTGLFIITPFTLTVFLVVWFVGLVERGLAPLINVIGGPVPGLGVAVAFALILLAGVLGTNIAGRHVLGLLEELFLRIPVFSWIYKTVKQLSATFSPGAKARFRGVVLIEYPRPRVYSMGFVTNNIALERSGRSEELLCVYIPTNHMHVGDYVLVPMDQVIETGLSHQDGIQAVLSAGASLPPSIKARLSASNATAG